MCVVDSRRYSMMNACNNNVSFGAKLVSKQSIKKVAENSYKAKDELVSFVKINPKSSYDIKALREVAEKSKKCSFAEDIYNDTLDYFRKDSTSGNVFALTTQKDNFSKLESDKILGLVEVLPDGCKKDSVFIDYILKIPTNVKTATEEFGKVGTGMLNGLKEFYKDKKISLFSLESAVEFYLKNGFKQVSKYGERMEYNPHKK